MAKIRWELDRLESYCLLVAQEFLRQMISEDGGIPLIVAIRPVSADTQYTEIRFVCDFDGDAFILDVSFIAGDLWPKKGTVHWLESGLMESETGVARYEFELRGNPRRPEVVFTTMRGGG